MARLFKRGLAVYVRENTDGGADIVEVDII